MIEHCIMQHCAAISATAELLIMTT